MLSLVNYQKRYGSNLILQVDKLLFERGIYWIKGQNGSGKSTLFKSIAGLIPYEGDIKLENIDLQHDPIKFRRLVNFAEAEPKYPGFLTAKDLIRFVGKIKGSSDDSMRELVTNFGVDSYYNEAVETFSSGMLKKLSLVLAFLGHPKVVILDEPLITLDDKTRNTLIGHIQFFHQRGVTFLLSSHQDVADNLNLTATYEIKNRTVFHA